MAMYCIIETEDGWTIVDHREDQTAEQAAHDRGGVVVDPGPYTSYEEANDAMISLQQELADDEDISDLPGTHPYEGRYETDD